VIAGGQHLIARAANTDELLAEFLDVLAVGRKRNRCGCDKQRQQQLADYSSPPRGGVARSAGVVSLAGTSRRAFIEASPYRAGASRHPVCAVASLGASSPPLGGGE